MARYPAFDRELFESLAQSRALELGRSLLVESVTASTNDVALRALQDGAPHGLLVVADHQTAGRGRRGRTWLSPEPGENLLFSVLLRLANDQAVATSITLVIGLAVRDALVSRLDEDVLIKWVNDIIVRERKLCGILVESQIRAAELGIVVGIGLNVHMRNLPEGLEDIATSLALLDAFDLRREYLLADILHHVQLRLSAWELGGFACMAEDFGTCDALRGKLVSVDGLVGVALGVDHGGALLLRVGTEPEPRRLLSGIVELQNTEAD